MGFKELNQKIRNCTKCDPFTTRNNTLCGEGNRSARLMIVAQAPGEKEDLSGKMFIGPSGKILDELLNFAHIKREEIYMTNLLKCMLPKCRNPKPNEIEACHTYLDEEIELINPQILVPLGYYASKYLLLKYEHPILPRIEFYKICGKLLWTNKMKIFPLQHPALLLYKPELKKILQTNYQKLETFSHECKWFFCCPMRRFYNQDKLERKWIELFCKGDWESCIRFQKEENGEFHEDNMLPDGSFMKI